MLWIDFNLYFYVRIHKQHQITSLEELVVNWFQFVFLREDSQVALLIPTAVFSCELISICIFTWGFTRAVTKVMLMKMLWIDFNLYFYVRIHKIWFSSSMDGMVVNWFQFVFLREDSQGAATFKVANISCELISICIFTWGFTSNSKR